MLIPLADRVVVRPILAEAKQGTLFIPETAVEKPHQGEVLAAGPGRYNDAGLVPMTVKTGDRVLFGKYSGSEVTINDEQLLVIREADILGILPPEPVVEVEPVVEEELVTA